MSKRDDRRWAIALFWGAVVLIIGLKLLGDMKEQSDMTKFIHPKLTERFQSFTDFSSSQFK